MFSLRETVTFPGPYNLEFSHFYTKQCAWCKGIATIFLESILWCTKISTTKSVTSKVFQTAQKYLFKLVLISIPKFPSFTNLKMKKIVQKSCFPVSLPCLLTISKVTDYQIWNMLYFKDMRSNK